MSLSGGPRRQCLIPPFLELLDIAELLEHRKLIVSVRPEPALEQIHLTARRTMLAATPLQQLRYLPLLSNHVHACRKGDADWCQSYTLSNLQSDRPFVHARFAQFRAALPGCRELPPLGSTCKHCQEAETRCALSFRWLETPAAAPRTCTAKSAPYQKQNRPRRPHHVLYFARRSRSTFSRSSRSALALR